MAYHIYNNALEQLFEGNIDFGSDDIRVMLVTSSYTVDIDSHVNRSDITNEVSGTGYTAGGVALSSEAVTQDDTNDKGKFDAANASWASSTITARGAVLYQYNGSAATDVVIAFFDFGSDQSSSNSTFTLNWHANGIITTDTISTASNLTFYNAFLTNLLNGTYDFDTDTIKVMLTTSSYTPDADSHEHRDDVTNEITGTGYTAGGGTLTLNGTVTQDDTNDLAYVDYDDETWSSASFTARQAVFYVDNGSAATDDLICVRDFGSDRTVTSADFTLTFGTNVFTVAKYS